MLLRLLSCLIFTFLSISLSAQTGAPQKVYLYYQITAEETLKLLEQDHFDPAPKYFHTLIPNLENRQKSTAELPFGNYLQVSNHEEELSVALELKSLADVDLIDTKKYLYFNPTHLNNQKKDSTKIWLDGKLLKWDNSTKSFRWKKKKRKKKLKVVAQIGDQVVFQEIKQDDKERKYRYYRGNLWRKLNPVRWPKRIFNRMKNTIEKIKDPKYRGYMVLNKPEFRPGDTLKLKGYFVNKRGRYPKGPLQLRQLKYGYNTKSLAEIYPDKNGNITYEIVLSDSLNLKLDQNYTVGFKDKYLSKFSKYFPLKDYQLDEVVYDFKIKSTPYFYGDTLKFLADGSYKNGLRVKDAKVKIQILGPQRKHLINNTYSFLADKVIIRDTIWEYEQPLNTKHPTEIIIPENVIPAATFNYQVIADFTNTNGEIQTKKIYLTPRKRFTKKEVDCFSASMVDSLFVVQNNCLNQPELNQVTMQITAGNAFKGIKKIDLPYREKIQDERFLYKFFTQDSVLIKSFDSYRENSMVRVSGKHAGDSVFVYINNPRGLPLFWEWYENKKLKTTATAIPKGISFTKKASRNKTYYIRYFYKWNGQIVRQELDLKFYKNKLAMQVTQPAIIQPGETIQIKVKIKDKKGKDAKNVNLTALSINDQFKYPHVNGPQITVGPFKKPKEKRAYRPFAKTKIKGKKIDEQWVKNLGLENDLFYKIRFPEDGLLFHYEKIEEDSFHKDIAQFAPYIVKDGQEQPVLMIKLNHELVYYYDVDDYPPYSFVGEAGMNQITIRTDKYEYTIPKVELKLGYKLEISIDENRYSQFNGKKNIKRISRPNKWTSSEKHLIKQSIFVLKNHWYNWFDETAFTQGNNCIHFINNKKTFVKIGPFHNSNIQFYPSINKASQTATYKPISLLFEPGFSYQITPERDRLYQYDFQLDKKLPKKLPSKYPLNLVYTPDNLKRIYRRAIIKDIKVTENSVAENTVIFTISKNKNVRLTTLLHEDSLYHFMPDGTVNFHFLPDGNYQLSVLYKDGSHLQHDFKVSDNILLFENLSEQKLTPDSSQVFLKKLILDYPDLFEVSIADLPQRLIEEKQFNLKSYNSFFSGISGTVHDGNSNEPLIGVNIYIKELKIGTVTDIDGKFYLAVPIGTYDVRISYVGFSDQIIKKVPVPYNKPLLIHLSSGPMLSEVTVTGYSRSKKKNRNLPTKDISALASTAAGLSQVDGVTVRGSRSEAVDYYIDGYRVQGDLIPEEDQLLPYDQYKEADPKNNPLRSNFADYAYFEPHLVTDQNGEAFFNVTYPDNTTRWNNFVIGMNRKKQAGFIQSTTDAYKKVMAKLAIPRFLVTGDQINLIGKSLNYAGDTIATKTKFTLNGETIQNNQFSLSDVKIEKALLSTPIADSITLTYELSSSQYQDGEKRSIPVLPIGIEETSGQYDLLTSDTTLSISFDPAKGPIYVRAESSQIRMAATGLKYLRNYRHECNEQAASKLLAFLWSEKLALVTRKKYDYKKQINRLIKLLEKRQNSIGYWSWWSTGEPNYWMSFHVIKVLSFAKENGYDSPALDQALTWITNEAENLSPSLRLRWLNLMVDIGQNTNFPEWIEPLETAWKNKTVQELLMLEKIKQAANLPINQEVLQKNMHKTILGNYYFGEIAYDRFSKNKHLENTLLAYDIYSKAGEKAIANGLKRYLLRKKNHSYWSNTILTAKIVNTLLSEDFGDDGKMERFAKLVVDGKTLPEFRDTIFQMNTPVNQPVRFAKTGNTPLYLTAYQQFWNPEPVPKEDIFNIKTELLQNNQAVTTLKANEKVQLKTTIKLEAKAEYTAIEIPIPAACSYDNATTRRWQNRFPYETHREYFKDRIVVYCRRLPAGTHSFTIGLEPGYTGTFTMNPATVEMMYFPTFYGRNGRKKVEVVD